MIHHNDLMKTLIEKCKNVLNGPQSILEMPTEMLGKNENFENFKL